MSMKSRRRHGVAAALLGLVGSTLALGLTAAPAQANPGGTGLVISEVYGGGGNAGTTWRNDFIELYNPTNAPISVNGWSVQGRPATNTAAATTGANITPLTGSVPAHGYYLIQEAAGTGGTKNLPTPDATGTMAIAAGGWQIWLSTGTAPLDPADGNVVPLPATIVDLVGGATNAISFETARIGAPAPGNTTSITRNATGADTDSNLADFTIASSPTPTNTLGETEPPAALPLVATDPGDRTYTAGRPISSFNLQATGGIGTRTWSVSPALPAGLSLNASTGLISGTPTATGSTEITATVTDSASPPATSSATFVISVEPLPDLTTIAAVQGTGAASPVEGSRVRVQGVVTATYPAGTGNLGGFYLQTGGADGVDYDTPGASDAIFVFMGNKTSPAVGTSVEVTGPVSEFFGTTEISPDAAADVFTLPSALPAVVPGDTLPGTDCALPGADCLTGAALESAREEHEGEVFQPAGDYTVTDSYDGSPFTQPTSRAFQMQGEIGLAANSTEPLMIPTELYDQSDSTAIAQRRAWNDAHAIILDDGADIDYTSSSVEDIAGFPWLTPTNTVRVGAAVTFVKPVILEFRRDFWRIQPQTKVEGGTTGASLVQFEQDRPAQPEDVGGDLKIATFNMLNYFNTIGEEWAATDGAGGARTCSYFSDRMTPSNRITNDECVQDATDPITGLPVELPGPRGAATQVSFLRQEAKELQAINTMDADVMSLEEVENSIKLHDPAIDGAGNPDANRDDALIRLVDRLNAHWAANHPSYVGDRWAYAPSPRPEALPTVAEQDAIRSAFIYNPQTVELVGRSQVLVNSAPFRNAREPLAQAFKPVGSGNANAFGVVVNHFKSKGGPVAPATVNGDNVDAGDGAGFYNGDRKRQAAALIAFADQFAAERGVEAMFLSGDFNSYAMEDPIQVITAAGYHGLHSADGEKTYSFGGLAGSLDHVFANDAANEMVTGTDVWSINANESVYYEYSRYNSNLTNLYDESAFRSSDHNPEIVGIDTGAVVPDPDVDVVQVLATNDFHGRILDDPGSASAGAASLAGAVKEMRANNPSTIFAAAGDLIGASTFESFVANDKPTIDALNEAGLEVSAAGNHEFDKGYHDLVDRVMAPESASNPDGGAEWQYIAANVRMRDDHSPALPETWFRELPDGRTVGFVGAVTEDLPALVATDGIAEIEVTDIVDAVNENADELKSAGGCGEADGCDLVIMLVHEGAASTAYSAVTDGSTFADIVAGANEDIDAIVSGHTHLAYNHKVPVQAWIDEGRAVTERPVVSAGQYGAYLNRLRFEFESGTDELVDIRQTVVSLKDFDADPATQQIVDDAVDAAAGPGNAPLGDLEGPFQRARRTDPNISGGPAVENRGGESTLGNLVAEIQRWKTGADIGFMNPGGLRADLLGNPGTPRVLTYRQAADVQPFANTLVAMDLTGDQIKTILEQQWQRDADGNIPSRPFLRLGTSDGFTVTQDATRPEGDRITGMWLHGEPLDPDATYRVSATSFLASGTGDNFWGFAAATNEQDTGSTDLQAVVDYMAEFADPLAVDYAQHQVGVHLPSGAPASYAPGDTLAFTLSSLAMTAADDAQDTQVEVSLGSTVLGTFPVTNTLRTEPDDEAGTASVSVVLPAGLTDGSADVTVRGTTTGTEVTVPIATSDGLPDSTVSAADTSMAYGEAGSVDVVVTPSSAGGTVTVLDGGTTLGTATLSGGAATVAIPAGSLDVGDHELTLEYGGDAGTSPSQGTVTMTVTKASPTLTATPTPASVQAGQTSSIAVTVAATGVDPTGTVTASVDGSVVDSAPLSGGAATLTVGPFNSAGDRTITIDYSGDSRTAAGSTTTTVAVTPKDPVDTTTTATAQPMVYGTPGEVSVTVTSTEPTSGSLQLLKGTTVISSGSVQESGSGTLTIPGTALAVGTHTLTVKYLGDSANKPSQGTVQVVVSKASSTTQVAVTPSTIGVWQTGAAAQVTVTAAGFTPTGSVVVKVDGIPVGTATLVNGTATVGLPPMPLAGDRNITAQYLGDGNAKTSQSSAATLTVVKATPTVTVSHSPSTVKKNTRATVTVQVASFGFPPIGLVRVSAPGQDTQYGVVANGQASFRLDAFRSTGAKSVTVTYLGDLWNESVTVTHVINVVN